MGGRHPGTVAERRPLCPAACGARPPPHQELEVSACSPPKPHPALRAPDPLFLKSDLQREVGLPHDGERCLGSFWHLPSAHGRLAGDMAGLAGGRPRFPGGGPAACPGRWGNSQRPLPLPAPGRGGAAALVTGIQSHGKPWASILGLLPGREGRCLPGFSAGSPRHVWWGVGGI